jgi:hypothetical protein
MRTRTDSPIRPKPRAAWLLAALLPLAIAACSRPDPLARLPEPQSNADVPASTTYGMAVDPSVPQAETLFAAAAAQGAQDARHTNPQAPMTPREEREAMPEAGHGNSLASPSLDKAPSGGQPG